MSDTYYVEFRYNGKEPNPLFKSATERDFMRVYNEYCDAVNPNYEKWNANYDGPDDGDDMNGEYVTYIRALTQPYIDRINDHWKKNRPLMTPIKRFFLGPEYNFSAELNNGTTVEFFLKKA